MIGLIKTSITDLKRKYEEIKELTSKENINDLDIKTVESLHNVLSDREFKDILVNINNPNYFRNINYEELCKIEGVIDKIHIALFNIREEYETNIFLKDGYTLDEDELNKLYNAKIKLKHPNLKIKRIVELYKKPPKKLKTYYSDEEFIINKFVFRKYMIGIIQMIYDHMDLVIALTGGEGLGKSCKASQDMYMLWWLLTELGIIDYKFSINEMFFNSLYKFREAEDKYFSQKFRILGLDEGNELNRQDWKEEEVKSFFQRLRRERHNQRIKIICIPVLGEMITNIVLSRVNFVFEMDSKNKIRSGTLEKGKVNFTIIPRGDSIYSPKQKRELTKDDIKTALYDNLKDKSYLKGMPKSIIATTIKSNGVWGYKEEDYIKNLKDTNSTFTVNEGIRFGDAELYSMYKAGFNFKDQGIKHTDPLYPSGAKALKKIKSHFENNINLLNRYKSIEENKREIQSRKTKL